MANDVAIPILADSARWLLGLAAVCSALATAAVRYLLQHFQMLDVPGSRSSHARTVPTGAGIGFALASSACWMVGGVWTSEDGAWILTLAATGIAIAAVGLMDDRRSLPALPRLALHGACAAVMAWMAWPSGATAWWWTLLLFTVAVVAIAWSINVFNFMDGIDGLAAAQGLAIAAGGMWIVGRGSPESLVLIAVAGALAGFLPWNLPPARVFMGDAGSTWIGFVLSCVALRDSLRHPGHLPVWLILAMPFVVDATVCLARRLACGHHPARPHRSHGYQNLARRLGGHRPALLVYAAAMGACLLTAAWALAHESAAWWGCALAYSLGTATAVALRSGVDGAAERHGSGGG